MKTMFLTKRCLVPALLAIVFCAPMHANAEIIDFEDSPYDDHEYGASYSTTGFLFEGYSSNENKGIRIWSLPGSKGIINIYGGGTIVMTQENGQPFSVLSLDIGASNVRTVQFTGMRADLSSVTQNVTTLGNDYQLSTEVLNGFDNLLSLTWNNHSNSVDNIVVDTGVPEPSAFALLAVGLLGIGGYATRKHRQRT